MNIYQEESEREQKETIYDYTLGRNDEDIGQLPTQLNLKAVKGMVRNAVDVAHTVNDWDNEDYWAAEKMATWIMPVVSTQFATDTVGKSQSGIIASTEGHAAPLRNLVKTSGIYAIASVVPPLVALALSPFLTRNLSPTDYGILALLTTLIGLGAGITQLGMASAFFRTYSYDFTSEQGHREVLATVHSLLVIISFSAGAILVVLAPVLANLFFHRASLSGDVVLAVLAMLLQNLTVPGFAWLRAESRPILYSLLSTCNLLVTLVVTFVLIGHFHMGVAGSLLATCAGSLSVVLLTTPVILSRAGVKISIQVARSLLSFGVPLVFSFVSYWVLQLSDRYLLSVFGSLAETAKYSVVYTLGSAMSVLVMGPFTLAWPSVMFTIAKRDDAPRIFQFVFRWFGLLLLLAAFTLSLVATALLYRLFPVAYHSAALIIPIVSLSIAFNGLFIIFSIGANIERKTWLAAVFTGIAALTNLLLNLVLIPHYQAMGAAASTLLAYMVLAIVAYIVNQRLYYIPFEVGMFAVALLLGVVLYIVGNFMAQGRGDDMGWVMRVGMLVVYTCLLGAIGLLWGRWKRKGVMN